MRNVTVKIGNKEFRVKMSEEQINKIKFNQNYEQNTKGGNKNV